jgi:hypothetical protein
MRALACDGSEVTPTSEGRTGGNEPSQRHERATSPMKMYGRSQVRDGLRDESPRVTELPEESEDGLRREAVWRNVVTPEGIQVPSESLGLSR